MTMLWKRNVINIPFGYCSVPPLLPVLPVLPVLVP